MKPYIKLLSVLLAITMLLGLCSCGKKEKEGAGMYLCTTIDYGFGDPVEDTEGRYLELRPTEPALSTTEPASTSPSTASGSFVTASFSSKPTELRTRVLSRMTL